MPLYLGSNEVTTIYKGATQVSQAYLGTSDVSPPSGDPAVNVTPPAISGIGYTGQTLTATAGTWTGETSVTGQWFADGAPIAGATSSTYIVSEANEGAEFMYSEFAQPGSVQADSGTIHNWIVTDMASATAVVWYNFNHTTSITSSGGFVDEWEDLINSFEVRQTVTAERPALNADHIAFAASQALNRGATPELMDATGENWAFVAHDVRSGATLGDDPLILGNDANAGTNNNSRRPYISYNDGQDQIRYFASGGNSNYVIGADIGWNIIGGANTSSSELLRVGGVTRDTGGGANTDSGHDFFTLGAGTTNQNLLGTLDIRGAVCGLGPIDTADIERVEGMMAWMHDCVAKLDAAHPYKLAPPTV